MARFLRATLPQPSIAGADDRLDPLCYLQLGKDARDVFVFQIGTQVETQALGTVDYKVHIDLDSNAATVQISRNHAMTPRRSAVLVVPSVIVEEENNYLINPGHPDSGSIRIDEPEPFEFDRRLLD